MKLDWQYRLHRVNHAEEEFHAGRLTVASAIDSINGHRIIQVELYEESGILLGIGGELLHWPDGILVYAVQFSDASDDNDVCWR